MGSQVSWTSKGLREKGHLALQPTNLLIGHLLYYHLQIQHIQVGVVLYEPLAARNANVDMTLQYAGQACAQSMWQTVCNPASELIARAGRGATTQLR